MLLQDHPHGKKNNHDPEWMGSWAWIRFTAAAAIAAPRPAQLALAVHPPLHLFAGPPRRSKPLVRFLSLL